MEARGGPGEDWIPGGPGPGPSLATLLSELPSSATVRYRGPGVRPWGDPESPLEHSDQESWSQRKTAPGTSPEEPPESQAFRDLPWPMEAKRLLWKLHACQETKAVSGIRGSKGALLLGRAWARLAGAPKMLVPWRTILTKIGGQYGAGTESYFGLLRFLLGLNILGALFQGLLILLPLLLLGPIPEPPSPGDHKSCGPYDPVPQGLVDYATHLTNLLSGEGHLEWSPLFYGFYPVELAGGTFQLPVAYLLSILVSGFLCLLLILRRSVSGLKQTLLSESGALTSYSHRVFSAWDFGLQGAGPVELRRRAIRYELQVELEEASVRKRAETRTRAQWASLWVSRIVLNLLVLALLGAAFYGVYWATDPYNNLQEDPVVQETPILNLLVAFLPSIFISVANLILPPIFTLITSLEGYTRSRQVQFILFRTVFLRLASLVVLLISLWNQITCGGNPEAEACATCGYDYSNLPCWETRVGQEMYKLLLFDLLTCLAIPLLVQFPRKLLGDMCGGRLGRLVGTMEFQVPEEVLGLVYGQTLVWVGGFYCPLLALLNTAKLLLTFYLKRLTLFTFFSPASRTFRASTANFFFPLVLLLGLAISAVPVLYGIFVIPPSKLCGPFRGQSNIWAAIPNAIQGLSQGARDFLFFLGTLSFAVPLMLVSSVLMVYTLTLASSYGRLVSKLKGHLQMESESKVLLAQRIVELSREERDL
ncbi:transmembrane channel-like protein 4 [Trichosurus vulpecula]|uniref:transmembrane channel-like protein 4 n=1 Tax=Trichosurus vulpecula TaxID=9337 RepID=UPI00186B1F2A|nr:transmembrane channel-like protein 4 [Trichosurus vulpecula]